MPEQEGIRMRRSTKRTPTVSELHKLKAAIAMLQAYCDAGGCAGCPFCTNQQYPAFSCVFGSFYPALWKNLIKEDKK